MDKAPIEKIVLNFSIKNPQNNLTYQIKIKLEDISSKKYNDFETELIKCEESQKELCFQKTAELFFYFDKKQKFKIYLIIIEQDNQKNEYERKTVLSSLISSPNSIYEKPLNKKNLEKDIVCIKINKMNNNAKLSVFDYLKSGIRILGTIAIDFSQGKNKEPISKSHEHYQKIVCEIINRMSPYNKKEQFFLYGYGAELKNSKNSEVLYKSIFNLNTKEKDAPISSENIFSELKKCFNNIIKYEKKIYLSSLIKVN